MKRFAYLLLAVALISMVSLAADVITLKGTIIDNKCAEANKADLANFIKTHTKQCALMPDCMASGYSLYADGKLQKFDKDSNAKIVKFLKFERSKLAVEVNVTVVGDELHLVLIKNQK
jgi:hypothetical protein